MSTKFKSLNLAVICFILSSCSTAAQKNITATVVPSATVTTTSPTTLTPTNIPSPVPTIQPTIIPVEGTTITQLNVRTEPSTASEILGVIAANSKVQIIGKDIGKSWWQITYETGDEGKGWVTAQYVETTGSPDIPVIGINGLNSPNGNTAIVIQQLNIRSGPGTNFNSLGILNKNDVVNLTGKNNSETWFQIDFPAGPDGKGWVNAGFVKADNIKKLPILSDSGNVIGTGTPADTPPPSTPTLVPAPMDFDSAEAPIKTILLGENDIYTALYNGSVSFPDGDTEDWVSIIPKESMVLINVMCMGSESVQIEIVDMDVDLACNETTQIVPVSEGKPFLIHIRAIGSANQLQLTNYILEVKAVQ